MTETELHYGKFSDENDEAYYCPLNAMATGRVVSDNLPDGCIEADVVGRYAGNLNLAGRPS